LVIAVLEAASPHSHRDLLAVLVIRWAFQTIDHNTDRIDQGYPSLVAQEMMGSTPYFSEPILVDQAEMAQVVCLLWAVGSKLWVARLVKF